MLNSASRLSVVGASLLTVGLATGAVSPFVTAAPAPVTVAQNSETNFSDIQDHWARPFIIALANQNIITGYPDGTYRPDQSADRDEFAAIVRQAFNQEQIRDIPSGSSFQDVPEGYWAAPAIETAYETGFMSGYENKIFRPQRPISKVDAIVTLVRNLDLASSAPAQATAPEAAPNQTPTTAIAPATETQTAPVQETRRPAKRPLLFPLAMTSLMQPFVSTQASARNVAPASVSAPAQKQSETPQAPNEAASAPATGSNTNQPDASTIISSYYADAEQVPVEATQEVAAATQSGLVVNHPDPKTLNPNQPATRGEIAALIHQALVSQNRLQPIPDSETNGYIINGR